MKQESGRRQPGIPFLQGGEDVNRTIALLALFVLSGCMPMTTLEVTKADGTSVKFSSAKDQVVQGLTADMASGTLTIEALESSASKVAESQLKREQSAAQTVLDLVRK